MAILWEWDLTVLGFDGAATFSDKTGVRARMKKHAPHAVFVHCHCHMLQLACMQAANNTTRIKHVHTMLTTVEIFLFLPLKSTIFEGDPACS